MSRSPCSRARTRRSSAPDRWSMWPASPSFFPYQWVGADDFPAVALVECLASIVVHRAGTIQEHDARVGVVADELQGGEPAGRAHVEMRSVAGGDDRPSGCVHAGVFSSGATSGKTGWSRVSPVAS